jgi:hypothetical protein
MDTHERIYHCLQPGCSKLKGFTYAGGLTRHEQQTHKMHGGAEFYCPHAGCSRAEGEGQPFTRKENLADHLRRRHNKPDTTSGQANCPIAIAPSARANGKRKLTITEDAEAPGETALLLARMEQMERRMEQLEEARFGQRFPE